MVDGLAGQITLNRFIPHLSPFASRLTNSKSNTVYNLSLNWADSQH